VPRRTLRADPPSREIEVVGRYIVRRILQFIPVFVGATFLIYALVFALPGDPIRALAGEKPLPPSVYAELVDRYNLNDPLPIQYAKYIGIMPDEDTGEFSGVLQGDFGTSFSRRDVGAIMVQRIPVTAKLAVMAFVFEIVLGLTAGVLAGLRRASFMDTLVLVSTTAIISIPVFVLGFLGQLVLGVKGVPIFPGYHIKFPVNASSGDFGALVLPAIVLGSVSLAYVARLTRTSLVENLRADYVRTATSKGLPRRAVVGRHALRNSLIPVITYLGIDLGSLMGGAIITEGIFNVPGIGTEVFRAVRQQEGVVVVGIVTFLVIIFMVSNLIVDIMYAWLDPRIRYE
jgi:oligopeptide transport system permease protein